jgi:hypothetical protein
MHLRDQLGAVFCDLASDTNQEAYLNPKKVPDTFFDPAHGVMAALAAAMLGGRRI